MSEITGTTVAEHSIDTGGQMPPRQAARRLNLAYRDPVRKIVEEWLAQGMIRESCSPVTSPIVVVKKKDGSIRLCVDYRQLNLLTKRDQYPLPRIDDIKDQLGKKHNLSNFDMFAGYNQLPMTEDSKELTAFTTFMGEYEYNVMPFGLCNAPATFQRCMNQVLHPFLGKFVQVYIDDVLVYSMISSHTWITCRSSS